MHVQDLAAFHNARSEKEGCRFLAVNMEESLLAIGRLSRYVFFLFSPRGTAHRRTGMRGAIALAERGGEGNEEVKTGRRMRYIRRQWENPII